MVNKVRETTLPAITYLESVRAGDVNEDQDVQRRFCGDNSFINGIAVTVLTGDYLPAIILGEVPIGQGMVQQYIVDAMQRTAALMKIRYENYKITSSIEDSEIEYQTKKLDENGKICRDEENNIIWEQHVFDIKNKTFEDFPAELKKRFDSFQLRIVTHQNCTMRDISKLVRRYNNHKAMNASQKAFTYLDLYARKVKMISRSNRFFKDTMKFSEAENKKGSYEKAVCESAMAVFHIDDWKKNTKQMNIYLNKNSSDDEFNKINEYADRINAVCGEDFTDVFVLKDVAVWFAVFDRFTKLGVEDHKFAEFISALIHELHNRKINDESYDSLEKATGTKDKKVIIAKVNLLETLMRDFLKVEESNLVSDIPDELKDYVSNFTTYHSVIDAGIQGEVTGNKIALQTLNFVKENVSEDKTDEDVELYLSFLDDFVRTGSSLLKLDNLPSLVGIMAYVCDIEHDEDFADWFSDYEKRHPVFNHNQKGNYTYMKADFDRYVDREKRNSKGAA